jgi:hypothetical protein
MIVRADMFDKPSGAIQNESAGQFEQFYGEDAWAAE